MDGDHAGTVNESEGRGGSPPKGRSPPGTFGSKPDTRKGFPPGAFGSMMEPNSREGFPAMGGFPPHMSGSMESGSRKGFSPMDGFPPHISGSMMGSDSRSGFPPTGGSPPRIFGSVEEALRVFDIHKSLMNCEDIQKAFDEKMDFTKPDAIYHMQEVQIQLALMTLDAAGLGHLKPFFGFDKFYSVLDAIFIGYRENPEILKKAAFMVPPNLEFPPREFLSPGDSYPDVEMMTLAGKPVMLSNFNIHKDRPLMILASSAS